MCNFNKMNNQTSVHQYIEISAVIHHMKKGGLNLPIPKLDKVCFL